MCVWFNNISKFHYFYQQSKTEYQELLKNSKILMLLTELFSFSSQVLY